MEGRNRSGSHSGGVVKNRSSSGCLIIKKKVDGVSGLGSSKGPKLHESKKEKKRPRLNASNSVSSDDELSEFYGRRGASLVYENDFDDMRFGRNGLMRETGPSRRTLDVYDFDEYDDLSDVEMLSVRHYHERGLGGGERRFLEEMPEMKNGSSGIEFESGSSKGDIIYKRRNSFNRGSGSEKIKMGDLYSGRKRFEMRSELPITMGKDKLGGSDEAIRLQGKNGVLKVRVKHNEDMSEQLSQNYIHVKGNNVAPKSKNLVMRPSPYSEKKLPKKPTSVGRLDKNQQRKRKPESAESSEESDEEAEDCDSSPRLQVDRDQGNQSIKRGRGGGQGSTQSSQGAQPIKVKEGKVKRGSGTEKQLLREKIRNMLVSAGWTIDYRPRRGRDYYDAVYVNPTGTAYWSIIKAYDALQKQLEDEGNRIKIAEDCSSFAPIADDVLSKLTRQTRKKIEKELKRKKREEAGGKRKKEFTSGSFEEDESDTDSGGSRRNDDKLSSFMKRSGKSLKGASKEFCRDRSNLNSRMQERGQKSVTMSNSRFVQARNSKKIGRCTLLVRNSKRGLDYVNDGFVPYTGKRNLLSWLIDSGTVKLSEKVHYMNRRCTRVMLEGWITREGIHCGCCSKILTVSKFEIHAASKLRQPYQNIYLSSGASLMHCQVDAWNRQAESLRDAYNKIDVNGDDPNDDTCAICGDGGNLICCDSCPSTFHQNCLGIEMLPPGDWHCPHCSCKFCGLADMSVTEGNDGRQDTVLTCRLCEGKYHCSCMEEMDDTPINSNNPPFCGKSCQELSERLQKLLGVKHELEAGLVWSLIHRTDLDSDSSVRGYSQRVEWNSKLAVALNVMDECFLPIVDRRSGLNMIHSVLYNSGSNITRLDYSSFYTAILEKGDEIISAASIRIRGTQFAEMPFIGTRHIYRRQGMCRRLFSAIEYALRSLKVEKMIIPAISELMDTWTTVFGFRTLEESDKQDMKIGNMLVFPGTDMLQKKLSDEDSVIRDFAGSDSFENDHNASVMPGLRKNSELHFSPGFYNAAAELENEERKDISVTDLGPQDMVCADESSLLIASIECCKEFKPFLPTENEEMKDKSVTDFASVNIVCTDVDTPHSASGDSCEEAKPSLRTTSPCDNTASVAVSNDFKQLVINEGTMCAELQLDKKVNDSTGDLMNHIFVDGSAGTCEAGSIFSDSAATHYVGVSVDCNMTQGANVATAESRSLPADGILAATSRNGGLNGILRNDNETQSEVILISKIEVAPYGKDHSLSEASHVHVTDTSMIEPTAEDDIRHLPEVEGDDAHRVSAESDVCSGSESLHLSDNPDPDTAHEPKTHVSRNTAADGKDHSLSGASHLDVVMEKPMIKPPAEDNICQLPEVEIDDAHIGPTQAGASSGTQFLHVMENIDPDAAHEPMVDDCRRDMVCSQITEAMPGEDRTCESPEHAGHSTLVLKNPQPDPNGDITEQPALESEVQHVEVANIQPISNLSCETSVNNADGNTCNSEDPLSVSGDSVLGVEGLLGVSELHDQGIV